jgi:hypothetical protein
MALEGTHFRTHLEAFEQFTKSQRSRFHSLHCAYQNDEFNPGLVQALRPLVADEEWPKFLEYRKLYLETSDIAYNPLDPLVEQVLDDPQPASPEAAKKLLSHLRPRAVAEAHQSFDSVMARLSRPNSRQSGASSPDSNGASPSPVVFARELSVLRNSDSIEKMKLTVVAEGVERLERKDGPSA